MEEPTTSNFNSASQTPEPSTARKKKKYYSQDAREIVWNVYNYFKRENIQGKILENVAEATGVGRSTVARIIKEGHELACGEKDSFMSPRKHIVQPSPKSTVDECAEEAIRRIVYSFHTTHKQKPTIQAILAKCRKRVDNRPLLMERKDIRELRVLCLRKMRDFRRQGRPIFYTDETYINSSHTVSNEWIDDSHQGLRRPISKGKRFIIVHAGGEAGFVNNGLFIFKSGHRSGDYHDDMNYKNYSRCMETQLIPNLSLRSVVVMDNASYHNVVAIKHPTANINKREMLAWLDERGIYYGENPTKPLLYSLIRKYKPDYINYNTDAVFSRYGHLAALELVSKL